MAAVQAQGAQASAGGAQAGGAKAEDEGVVDAEFKEVKRG
jgi:hypothetical protein